jgi:hypothetical protein
MPEYALDLSPLVDAAKAPATSKDRFSSIFPVNTHICHFYKSERDLLELLTPYFKEGLLQSEFCLWGVSAPLTVASAKRALDEALGGTLDSYVAKGQIEIFDVGRLYGNGIFDAMAVKDAFLVKVNQSRKLGWPAFRCDGMASGVDPKNWRNYQTYEAEVTRNMRSSTLALCSYDITTLSAENVIDVVNTHQACLMKKNGAWYVIEPARRSDAPSQTSVELDWR